MGRYPQRCTARWLVRSAFVKQLGYASCTSTIPQSSVQHPRYFEDLPEPEENATIVVPTDIFRNCLHPNLRYPKSIVSENFQAVPLGQGRPYIHPSTSFSSPVIRIGLFMIAKVDAIVDSGSGAKNNVIYEDLLSGRS